jgi:hypothetical protein
MDVVPEATAAAAGNERAHGAQTQCERFHEPFSFSVSGAWTATGTGLDIVGTTGKIEQFPAIGRICRFSAGPPELKVLQAGKS